MLDFETKGLFGERSFLNHLNIRGIAYTSLEQTPESKAHCFHGVAKRPDVLIPLGDGRVVAIDVKSRRVGFWLGPTTACVGVAKRDLQRLAQFESMTGIAVFLAFFDGGRPGFGGFWRLARLSTIAPIADKGDYVLLDINQMPRVSGPFLLMDLLRQEAGQ
jgi:hypothetical protein